MNIKFRLLICLIFLVNVSFSQVIEGNVFDITNKEPLIGALILVAEDSTGTTSDLKGEFTLKVNKLPILLVVSYIGYEPIQISINESNETLNVGLKASEQHLNEIIIQATRFNQKLKDIPASVNAITEADLQRNDETLIMPAINIISGVFMESGSLNTNRIAIRGIGSRTPYSTNRVRAYFDNIPLTTGEGESTIEDIDLNSLQRVEIIKGPASSIYGSGLGGTINLISSAPQYGMSQVQSKLLFGSYGLRNLNAVLSKSVKDGYLNLSINDIHSDGYRENSRYDRKSLTFNSSLYKSKDLSMSFLGSFIGLKSFIPSSIDEETFENSPKSAARNWAEAEGYEYYLKAFTGFSVNYNIHENLSNSSSVFFSIRDGDEPRPFDILKENTVATGFRTHFEYSPLVNLKAQAGAEIFMDWHSWSTYENLYKQYPGTGSVIAEQLSDNKERRNYYNLFLQMRWAVNEKIGVETGFNLNKTYYNFSDLFEDNIDHSGNYDYDAVFSPRIGVTYSLRDNWNVYGSVSHGYSMPSVEETLTPEGLINPEIAPETGINYEIGVKGNWFKNKLYGELSLYHMDIQNLLVAERVGPDQYVGLNAGQTIHEGLELMLNYIAGREGDFLIKPFISLTLANYRFEKFIHQDTDYSGKKISGFPSEIFNAGFSLKSPVGLYIIADYRYVSEAPLNDLNTIYNDKYSLVNFKGGYSTQVGEKINIDLKVGVNNVMNEHYASMVLVNAVGFGNSSPRYFYPGLPRNYFFGLSFGFKL